MSKPKKFSAINDFLNPKQEEKEVQVVEESAKAIPIAKNQTTKVKEQVKKEKTQVVEKSNNEDPEKQGFVRWTTYIKPQYKKFFKMLAVEEDTDIYKLLDALLEKEFKKKNNNT